MATSGGNLAFSSRVQASVDYFGPTDILNINLDVTSPPGSGINHDDPGSPESHLVGWDDPGDGIGDIRANIGNPNPPYPALVTLCNQVNPITWLTSDDPPIFIGHGNVDTSVPIEQRARLADTMLPVGVFQDYRSVNGAGHGFLSNATDASARNFLLAQFFDPPLTGLFSEEYDPENKIALGNFPRAYSHLGLIRTATMLHSLWCYKWAAGSSGVPTLVSCPVETKRPPRTTPPVSVAATPRKFRTR